MSFTPPDAPPYPLSPDDEHQDEEASAAAYAEILVGSRKNTVNRIDLAVLLRLVIPMVFWFQQRFASSEFVNQ
jgi:hypothetical protein